MKIKYILFPILLVLISCKKYDNEKFLKFDHLFFSENYKNNLNNYFGEIEPIALKINPKSKLDYSINNIPPNSVFSYPFEVNFEHIKANKYKSYVFRLYRKEEAIFYINWFDEHKKDIPDLPRSVKITIYRNLTLSNKIIEECNKKNINVIKSDFNTKFYTKYHYKYSINGRDIYILLKNCSNKEAKIVIEQIDNDEKFPVTLRGFCENFEFDKLELTKIEKLKEGKTSYLLTFNRSFSGGAEIKMSLENGKWHYKLYGEWIY